jgi:hypothetical protein
MAGYSTTPLPKKLGIGPGARLALVDAPQGFAASLDPLPLGVTLGPELEGPCDVILLFAVERTVLRERIAAAARTLAPSGGLWVIWPKRASGVPTDLSEPVVREFGLGAGLVDNKVCAVDAVWSGLRFVVRLADRAGWPGAVRAEREERTQ